MIAVRRSTVLGMSAQQRRLLRIVCERIDLGDPAVYQAPAGAVWYVFADHRVALLDIAILGCFMAALAAAPDITTRAELWDWIKDTIVLPENIVYTQRGNPWQETLTANGAPATVQAASNVPDTWTVVST